MKNKRFAILAIAALMVIGLLFGQERITPEWRIYLSTGGHESCPGWHWIAPEEVLVDQGGKYIRVAAGEDGIEFAEGTGAPATSFLPFYGQGWKWGFFINGSTYKEDLADWSIAGASAAYSRDANGDWLRYATGASANNNAYLAGTGYAITQMNQNFSVIFRIKTAASIAKMHLWVGMGSVSRAANNDTAAGSFVGVRYSSATSANWYTVTRDGTDQNENDSALAVAADTCYVIKIVITGGNTAKIYINGTLYSTTTTNVPATTTGLDGYVWWYTDEAVLKQVYFGYYYGEAIFSQTG